MDANVHFIPWRINLDLYKNVSRWSNRHIFWHVIHYSSIINPVLHFVKGGAILIHGWGAPNDTKIYPGPACSGTGIEAGEVVERLRKTGFAKNYIGKVHCYSDFSANGIDKAFAIEFLRAARGQGVNPKVVGYDGAVQRNPDKPKTGTVTQIIAPSGGRSRGNPTRQAGSQPIP